MITSKSQKWSIYWEYFVFSVLLFQYTLIHNVRFLRDPEYRKQVEEQENHENKINKDATAETFWTSSAQTIIAFFDVWFADIAMIVASQNSISPFEKER